MYYDRFYSLCPKINFAVMSQNKCNSSGLVKISMLVKNYIYSYKDLIISL